MPGPGHPSKGRIGAAGRPVAVTELPKGYRNCTVHVLRKGIAMKNILIACNAGMSTSLLVQKMRKEAASQGIDATIDAEPLGPALEDVQDYDVLMLGPQIKYAEGDAKEAADGKVPVRVIAMSDYGRMNAKKILADAQKAIEEGC